MNNLSVRKEPGRIYWLDVARTIAILSISLNHAVNRCYDNYQDQIGEYLSIPFASTVFKATITVFSHLGVPLFLMISGALLLSKRIDNEEKAVQFYIHNIGELLITSEIWYFIMYFVMYIGNSFRSHEGISIPKMLMGLAKTLLFVDQITFSSMWYIPMILCVYLLIPVFSIFIERTSGKLLLIPCTCLFFSTMIIPNVNALFRMAGSSYQIDFAIKSLNIYSGYYLYVFSGYWIKEEGLKKLSNYLLTIGCALTFIVNICIQLFAYSSAENYLVEYNHPLILINSVLVFELLRRHFIEKRRDRWNSWVTYIARISFGIYFIHIIIMTTIDQLPIYNGWIRPVRLLFYELVSVGCSVIIIRVLSRWQYFKKYLFMIK